MFAVCFSIVASSSFFLSHQNSPSSWRAIRWRDWQSPMSAVASSTSSNRPLFNISAAKIWFSFRWKNEMKWWRNVAFWLGALTWLISSRSLISTAWRGVEALKKKPLLCSAPGACVSFVNVTTGHWPSGSVIYHAGNKVKQKPDGGGWWDAQRPPSPTPAGGREVRPRVQKVSTCPFIRQTGFRGEFQAKHVGDSKNNFFVDLNNFEIFGGIFAGI